jgi:phosphate-selective porin OprO/OprP
VFAFGALAAAGALVAALPAMADEPPAPPPPAAESTDERLERLEQRLQATQAELEALKQKEAERAQGAAAPPPPGARQGEMQTGKVAPSAAGQGEKFEKKWGKDAILTWDNGFWLRYIDEDETDPEKKVLHSLHPGGLAQVDLRLFADDRHPQDDTFLVRRARLYLAGTVFRSYDFVIEGDFATGSVQLRDGYINIAYVPWLQLRAGNIKIPMLREQITSDKYLDFIERPMAVQTMQIDRDLGAMVHGDLGFLNYQIAALNGRLNNTADSNDDKDLVVRLGITPFKPEKGLLRDVEVAGSFSYGHNKDFLPTFQTIPGGTTFLNLATAPVGGKIQDGYRERAGAELTLPIGPFKLQGEFMWMTVERAFLAGGDEDIHVRDWYVDLMYMLTGEEMGLNRKVFPSKNLNPFEGGFGAWQVGVRFEQCSTDEELRRHAVAKGTDTVNMLEFGINWYWNPLMKFMVNYYHAWFDDQVEVDSGDASKLMSGEDVVLFRWQVEW